MVGLANASSKRFELRQQFASGAAPIQSKQQAKSGEPSNFYATFRLPYK